MTDQEMFEAYVAHRRSMYPWRLFWCVMIPVLSVSALYIAVVIHILRGA